MVHTRDKAQCVVCCVILRCVVDLFRRRGSKHSYVPKDRTIKFIQPQAGIVHVIYMSDRKYISCMYSVYSTRVHEH